MCTTWQELWKYVIKAVGLVIGFLAKVVQSCPKKEELVNILKEPPSFFWKCSDSKLFWTCTTLQEHWKHVIKTVGLCISFFCKSCSKLPKWVSTC